MKKWFLKLKPSSVLLLLKDSQQQWYPSKLARSANCSYVHAVNLLSELKKGGMVELEKKGRQSFYRLTERGSSLAAALDDLVKKCEAADYAAKSPRQEKAAADHSQPAEQRKPDEKK